MGGNSAHIHARMEGALGHGAWEPNTPETVRCSQILPRAATLGEEVQHPEGPAVVVLAILWSVGAKTQAPKTLSKVLKRT